MYGKTKSRVHSLLHPEIVNQSRWDKIINTFILILIILNVFAVSLETVPSVYHPNKKFFDDFDRISVIIFTIEYILRVWSTNHDPKYKHSIFGRLKYMLSPAALIDLLAILPFYIHIAVGLDLRVLRMLRLLRFLRIFRLTAYTKETKILANVFKKRFRDLMLAFFIAILFIFISSFLIYFVEHPVQPDKFTSIPETIWWAVETITTLGYGDIYPVSPLGKFFTIIIMLAGIALLAFPSGVITAGFMEELRKSRKQQICPHCGKPIDDHHES